MLQKAFKKYFNRQKFIKEREEAAGTWPGKTKSLFQDSFNDSNSSDLFHGKKQRRQHSLNRKFYSDYIGLDEKPGLKAIVGKREKIEFAQTVTKYDKKLKVCGIFISNLCLKGYLK